MGLCSPCGIIHGIAAFCQVAVACAIAGIVAVQLVNVDVNVGVDGSSFQYACLLGQDYGSSSLCTYTFVVCGISLGVSLAISMLQCCTCNLCGLGKILDVILGALGTAWWAVASGVIGANATAGLPPGVSPEAAADVSEWRDVVPILCWVECGLFAAIFVSSLMCVCGCCGS